MVRKVFMVKYSPLVVYYIVIKPYESLLSRISKQYGIFITDLGVFRTKNSISTVIKCYFKKPSDFDNLLENLVSSPNILQVKVLEKNRKTSSLIITKKVCDFYEKILANEIPMLLPYSIIYGYKRLAIIPLDVEIKNIIRMVSRYGRIVNIERLSFDKALLKLSNYINIANLISLLSDKQLSTLSLAYAEGLYEWPRKISISKLAMLLGLSKSTTCEYLRKAEAKIVKYVLADLLSQQTMYKDSL